MKHVPYKGKGGADEPYELLNCSIDVIYIHAGLFQIHSPDQEMSLYFISIYTWVNFEALDTNKTKQHTSQGTSALKWLLRELQAPVRLT